MSIPVRTNLDLGKNSLENARIQNLASAPSSPVAGQIYYDTVSNTLLYWNGTSWLSSGVTAHSALTGLTTGDDHTQYVHITNARTITAVHTFAPGSAGPAFILGTNALSQLITGLNADKLDGIDSTGFAAAVHTHVASDITNFDTQVRTSRLDQMAAPTADLSINSHKLTNVTDPTNPQDAATKNYVDSVATGLDAKASVRAATTANLNLNLPGAAIDGVTMASGNRFLVKDQTTGADNGIYIWNGASTTASRATDADSSAEVTGGMFTFVEEGTVNADTGWVLSTNNAITLGTTSLAFTQFSAAGQITASNLGSGTGVFSSKSGTTLQFNSIGVASTKISIALTSNVITLDVVESNLTISNMAGTLAIAHGGTGAVTAPLARVALGTVGRYAQDIGNGTLTTVPVNHNLGSQDCIATVYDKSSPFQEIWCEKRNVDANNMSFLFGVAPTTNQYRVVIIG